MSTPAQSFPPLLDLARVPVGPVLVVAPHPDDEIIGCGGAIALHCDRGDAVHVALVTRGEGGGDAEARWEESRRSAGLLGKTEVSCLESTDGAVAADADLPARIAELANRFGPRVVYAPSPFEMHKDHVATLTATATALAGRPDLTLLLYEVNTEAMASFLLDITPVAERKRAALSAFASQLGMIDIVDKADARGRARTVNVDLPAVTHAEAFMDLAPDRVAEVQRRLAELAGSLTLDRP
ncbi:MAG: PIG-L deacetylase family protein [Planctomycetota bacterium]|jgi:LmbE family N-acetylglucosaminyl deacetylase